MVNHLTFLGILQNLNILMFIKFLKKIVVINVYMTVHKTKFLPTNPSVKTLKG